MENSDSRAIYIVPSLIVFLAVLFVTLSYRWPFGWDIFYYIHISKVYITEGLTLFDPIYNAPAGNIINYPPIFHFTLILLSYILRTGLFETARFMQPFLAGLVVLSVSFVASKFYKNQMIGLAAGILLFSGAISARLVQALPENMALIFFPLSIYFYYKFFKEDKPITAVISGLLMGLIALIHPAATFCLGFTVTIITLGIMGSELYMERNLSVIGRVLFSYILFIISAGLIAALWWAPAIYFKNTGPGGVSTALQTSRRLSILKYPNALGYPAIILSAIGVITALKRFELEDRIILLWILAVLLLSKAYYFGINVITYRVLIYIMIPLSILAASGLISAFKSIQRKDKNLAWIFLALILILATFQGFSNLSSKNIADYGALTHHGRVVIAPPAESEVELAEWFNKQGDNGTISFSNYFTAGFVMAYTNRPVNPLLYEKGGMPTAEEISKNGTRYLVFDKRLKATGNFTFKVSEGFIFYNPSLINVSSLNHTYLERVYENRDFVVYLYMTEQ